MISYLRWLANRQEAEDSARRAYRAKHSGSRRFFRFNGPIRKGGLYVKIGEK